MKILIDLNTIKPNPRAGETSTMTCGAMSGFLTCDGNVEKLPDADNLIIVKEEFINIKIERREYLINGDLTSDQIEVIRNTPGYTLKLNREITTYYHHPIPDYLFDYDNPPIFGKECGHKFDYKDMITHYNDNGTLYNECPVCESFISNQIEFESITEALERMASIPF